MKNYLLAIGMFIVISSVQFAQVPNAGFESWENDDPAGWFTLDFFGNPVSQSTDKHTGSFAAKLEIVDFGGDGYPPVLTTIFPISQRYGSLKGYYKFQPIDASQALYISVLLYSDGALVGGNAWVSFTLVSSYIEFDVPVEYITEEIPDSMYVQFTIGDTSETGTGIGAYALIDDLSLSGSTGVEPLELNPSAFSLKQNYPNPFNPSTKIIFSITEQSSVKLTVYDILGNEITKLVEDNYPAGEYRVDFNAANLPGGIYIAKLNAGKFSKAIKMTLLK